MDEPFLVNAMLNQGVPSGASRQATKMRHTEIDHRDCDKKSPASENIHANIGLLDCMRMFDHNINNLVISAFWRRYIWFHTIFS